MTPKTVVPGAPPCAHAAALNEPAHAPHAPHHTEPRVGCEECLATGARWVHLRACAQCGHVGCCDSSPNKHATKHYHATRHPVMLSFEPGERWGWCYVDEADFALAYEPRALAR